MDYEGTTNATGTKAMVPWSMSTPPQKAAFVIDKVKSAAGVPEYELCLWQER